MTLPLLFAFSFVVGFGAVVTPGPVSTAIVSESARRGFIVGPLVYFGHISGDYLWDSILSGVVGGGRKWITDRLYKWIIVTCGLYLIYLGGVFLVSPFQ